VSLVVGNKLTAVVGIWFHAIEDPKRSENAMPFLFVAGPLDSAGLLRHGWDVVNSEATRYDNPVATQSLTAMQLNVQGLVEYLGEG
jgi:hypothetical protein